MAFGIVRKWAAFVSVAALSLTIASVAMAPAAEAASITRLNVVNITTKKNVTGAQFASCKITTKGGTCSISKGKSADRTVQVSLGASRDLVSAGLSISKSKTQTTSVGCDSPKLKAGQVWRGRSVGKQYTYKVQQQKGTKPRFGGTRWTTVATSGYLKAHDPSATDISCGL